MQMFLFQGRIFAINREFVLVGKNGPVSKQHVSNGRYDIGGSNAGAFTELAGKRLDADLTHAVAFEHRLNRQFGADEWTVGLKIQLIYQRFPHQSEAGTYV